MSRPLLRAWAAALVAGLALGCGGVTDPAGTGLSTVPAEGPASVLADWDAARSAAWAEGDPGALAALYVPGAPAGVSDVRLLRSYVARGLRVRGLRFQRLAVRVLAQDATVLRLEVVERLLPATVRRGSAVRRLPAGQPVRRVIELRRTGNTWRVDRVVTR